MTGDKRVIHLHQRDPQEALARLNRITGLRFARWPERLLDHVAPEDQGHNAEGTEQQPSPSPGVSSG